MLKAFLELLGLGGKIAEARTELKRATIEAKTKAVLASGDREGAWETMAAQNAINGWADDAWTGLFIALVLANFIPPLQPFMEQGYSNLEDLPAFLKWGVGASLSFAFARKNMPNLSSWKRNPKS